VGLFRSPRSDVLVLLATFSLTVLIDLAVAIQVGMVLAAFLFLKRMAGLSQAGYITDMMREEDPGESAPGLTIPDGVEIFEIQGTFFFGAASTFRNALRRVEKSPKVLILRLPEVLAVDATGLRALEELEESNRRSGTVLVLSGLRQDPRETLRRSGFLEVVGPENVTGDIETALVRAREILASLEPAGSPGGPRGGPGKND
jgi:SulP family sulfate permease